MSKTIALRPRGHGPNGSPLWHDYQALGCALRNIVKGKNFMQTAAYLGVAGRIEDAAELAHYWDTKPLIVNGNQIKEPMVVQVDGQIMANPTAGQPVMVLPFPVFSVDIPNHFIDPLWSELEKLTPEQFVEDGQKINPICYYSMMQELGESLGKISKKDDEE